MLNRNLFHILFIAETKIEGTFSNYSNNQVMELSEEIVRRVLVD